jgi:hypothetical protein
MKFYVYCVAEKISHGTETLFGVGQQQVQFVDVDELVVVLSEFHGEAVGVTRENVLRHAEVVRNVLARTTPLPFRFGTLVSPEGLQSFVTSRKKALIQRLDLVRDSVEMSVKIIWPISTKDKTVTAQPNNVGGVGVGAAFLLSKRDELKGTEHLSAQAAEIAEWINGAVKDLVRQQNVNVRPAQKLVFAGSYLIDRTAESGFRTAVNLLMSERPDLHFLISGPWPPYTFANIELEFETHFGVI